MGLSRTGTWSALADYHDVIAYKSGVSKEEGSRLAGERYLELRRKVFAIQDQEFFVARRDKTSNLAQMAELYNRINAGGKQVETEERAFATLVGLQPTNGAISAGLRAVFSAIHPERRSGTGRDALLKREEERSFGFKLFIRVFLHVCQHHFGQRQRRSSFSFDVIDRGDFQLAYSSLSGADVELLWDETRRVLEHVRTLLDQELHCDDLRSLPDASGLMPVLQLLIHYPDLEQAKYRPLLAALCLRIALADLNGRTVLEWIARAGDPTRLAFDVLPPLMIEAASLASKQLSHCLEEASSVQDRYVLLLYWLERHLGAHDFRYDRIPNAKCDLKAPELPLDKDASPEKQHVVPFSYAPLLFGPEVRRTAAHPFNNVGNLTYVSAQLNGLGALSDYFADLAGEREEDGENLIAHFLLTPEDAGVLEQYEWLKKHFETGDSEKGAAGPEAERLNRFKTLTAARRHLIGSGFEQWLRDLDAETLRRLDVSAVNELAQLAKTTLRLEPRPPLFPIDTHAAHVLRQLGLGNETEDRLFLLLREGKPTVVGPLELRVQITKRKQVWVEIGADGVVLGVRHLSEPLRLGVFQTVGLSDAHGRRHPLDPVPDFQPLIEYCASHEREFGEVVWTKKGHGPKGAEAVRPPISELNYSSSVADRLAKMGGSTKEKPRQGADLSLRFWQKKSGRDQQVLRIDLHKGGRTLGLRFSEGLGLEFTDRFPTLPVRESKQRTICRLGTEEKMIAVLDWVAAQLSRT